MTNSELDIQERKIRGQGGDDVITHFSTGIVVLNNNKVLMVRREPNDFLGGNWELPGGGIDEGETFKEGLTRELAEETGLKVKDIIGIFKGFDYTNEKHRVRQVNFLVTTTTLDITLSHEHDAFLWVGSNDLGNITMTKEMLKCVKNAINIADKKAISK
ncbi:MAG: NUDIX hydrolase [Patescibacteria group bacterium]